MPRRALLSARNRAGLPAFARGLARLGYRLYATGGTRRALEAASVDVLPVSELTRFPEILDGRLKTLHPGVFAGLLARRDDPQHMATLAEHDLVPLDLVCVNLYPFAETAALEAATADEVVEQIDIGGPAAVRAAAKNHRDVVVVVRPERYSGVLAALSEGTLDEAMRRRLAAEAFAHVAAYDAQVAAWLRRGEEGMPAELSIAGSLAQVVRYGENPHQLAAFYRLGPDPGGLGSARQLQGPDLSYNNIQDAAAAYELVAEFARPAAAIVKHTNPCGVGVADAALDAYQKAHDCDPQSAFGGVVALNRPLDGATAARIVAIKTDVVIAPSVAEEATEALRRRKNTRVLEAAPTRPGGLVVRSVPGGLLAQTPDTTGFDRDACRAVTQRRPTPEEWEDLELAWLVAKHVKSNAVVLAQKGAAVGVGAGQMSRVESAAIAVRRAGERSRGAAMASDGFFSFADGVEAGLKAGVTAIIQPGGSIRDHEAIAAADAAGAAMVFTGERHFRH